MRLPIILIPLVIKIVSVSVTAQDNDTVVPTLSPTSINEPAANVTAPSSANSSLTMSPVLAPVPNRSCYSNLTEIENLVRMKNPFEQEIYIFCPNTVYEFGTLLENETLINGFKPLFTRSRSTYQCGEDGLSSNNCIFRGGDYQVFLDPNHYNESDVVGVVMKGLTFDDAQSGSIYFLGSGDMTFTDCIFRNHANSGVMSLLYFNANTENDVAIRETLTVIIDGCLFVNNTNGGESDVAFDGLISSISPDCDVIIKNSIFLGNNFLDPQNGVNGYAIQVANGTSLTISDSCFINNTFSGAGVVIVQGPMEEFTTTNNYGTVDGNLECSYASVAGSSCVEFDSTVCNVERILPSFPISAPTPTSATSTSFNLSTNFLIPLLIAAICLPRLL